MFAIREPSIEAMRAAPVKFRFGSNRRLVLVDAFTASAVLAVHDAANPDNQAKIGRMIQSPAGLMKVASFSLERCR
jgi:hypothetical protein